MCHSALPEAALRYDERRKGAQDAVVAGVRSDAVLFCALDTDEGDSSVRRRLAELHGRCIASITVVPECETRTGEGRR